MTPDVRVSERVEWRNVYLVGFWSGPREVRVTGYESRKEADERPRYRSFGETYPRIAVERVTITERVERFPVPEEGGR